MGKSKPWSIKISEKERNKIESLNKKFKELEKKYRSLQAEFKETKNSEQRLKKLFEFAPDAYYLHDLRGNFIDGNKAAADLLGQEKEKLIGKNFLKVNLLRKDQIPRAAANLSKNILGKPTGPDEFILYRKDGTEISVEAITQPIKMDGKRVVMGAVRDITDRKRIESELQDHREQLENKVSERTDELNKANLDLKKEISDRKANEKALRDSEQKFRGFIETSADIVFQVSRSGNIEFVSPRVKEMYGYEADELIGRNLSLTTPSEDLSVAMKGIHRVFSGKMLKNFEIKQQDKNGYIINMEINAIPIRKKGKIVGLRGIMRDISERKKTETILRESEERYRDLVEKANIGILIDDVEGKIQFFNKKFTEFFGYTSEEMRQQSVQTLVHPEHQSKVFNYHQNRIKGKRIKSLYEFRGRRKNGESIYLEVHASTVKEDGKITGTKSYMWDITSRKVAENARKESEQRYRDLFNKMRDGSLVVTNDGTILDFNKAFLNMVGYRAKQLMGKNWYDLTPANWHSMEQNIINKEVLKRKYSRVYDKELICKDGTIIPVELRTHLIDEKSKPQNQFWIMVRDISARRKIENEVNMLAQTVRSVRECVSVTDLEDNLLFVNDAFLNTYGYKRSELIGKNISIIRPDKYAKKILNKTQQGGWEGELINRHKDGTFFTVFLSTSIIKDERSQPIAMVGVATDISDRKKFDEQFRQVQKMEAIGQLAGGIAHDFNNILTAINGYAELALMKMESKNPLFKEITGILKAGKRASGLVRQLLAFSRKQVIEPRVIDVNNLIIELDKMLHRLIGEDINVKINLDQNLGHITADPGQIEQILVNIVVNARDAINQRTETASEKTITIETSNVYLDKAYNVTHPGSKEGMHVCIALSDTGIGMNQEIQNKVFEPFFTTKDKIKGTGLGLATVYGIVKQNDGYIFIYSEINKGTTVRVYWPMEQETEIKEPRQKPVVDIRGGKETILFVEDNAEVRKFTISALKALGYKVLEASHGADAIKLIQQNTVSIDMIITDVIMPEMGGRELAEKISKMNSDIRILFTSGYADNHVLYSGTLKPGVNFIQKPYSIESLASKVRQVLDN